MIQPPKVSDKKGAICVILDNSDASTKKSFHCSVCGRTVFEYYSSVKLILPGEPEIEQPAPVVIQCKGSIMTYKNGVRINTHCKTLYWVY